MKRTTTTLALIERDDEVLLAMKKRGFGEGWWNGYGGKLAEGEPVEDAMVRELEEESTLIAKEWRERGVMEFEFQSGDIVEMHIFEVTKYQGEPQETEEMKPKWFKKSEVPYDQMWPADREWLELFFEGKDFEGKAIFDAETKTFLHSEVREIEKEVSAENEIQRGREGT